MAVGMMGWLVPETQLLGTFQLRGHTLVQIEGKRDRQAGASA